MKPLDATDTVLLIQQIVWAYTEALDSQTDSDELARFQSVMAHRLLHAPRGELLRHPRKSLSIVETLEMERRDNMKAAVQLGLASDDSLLPLPKAIAFWPLDADGKPKGQSKFKFLPEALKTQTPRASFLSKDGKNRLGYFEITTEESGLPPITSVFASTQTARSETKRNPKLAWALGLMGAVLFIVTLAGVLATGNLLGTARTLVADAAAQYVVSAPPAGWTQLRNSLNDKCKPPDGAGKAPALGGLCKNGALDAVKYRGCLATMAPFDNTKAASLTPACSFVWTDALLLADAEWNTKSVSQGFAPSSMVNWVVGLIVSQRLTGADIVENRSLSIVAYFYLCMVSLVLLFIAFGLGTKGRWSGLAISDQNRLSLSLSQITAWTIVLLSAYAVYAAFNVGALSGYWTDDVIRADVSLFPALPGWTWAVMGITVAAPFASTLIKSNAPDGATDALTLHTTAGGGVAARAVDVKESEADASVGDLVTSEEPGKSGRLAITRVQNVIITATLLFTYTAALAGAISDLLPQTILTAFSTNKAILSGFPEPEVTFTALLGLSHGTYLLGKFQPKSAGSED